MKIVVLSLAILLAVQVKSFLALECPPSSQMTSCSPKCIQDSECSSMGGRCCPNLCNYKSCALPKNTNKNTNNKAGASGSGAGNYCGNMKCSAFEKCDKDKTTQRFKCVRA